MANHNPYTPGTTITDPAMFFGRKTEVAELSEAIRKGGCKAVVGLRRIGKSSLLYHVAHHATHPDHVAVVYLDLLNGRYHTANGLLSGILTGLQAATNQRYPAPTDPDMNNFTTIIEQMKADGYQAAVCLDELERLMNHPAIFDRSFFEAWRALGSMGALAFITASRVRISDVVQHNGDTSPFANIFTQLTLAGLDGNAARSLLTRPFQQANQPAPPPAHIDHALELTGHHPFFLQIAGERLWQAGGANRQTFRQQIAQAARDPMERLWHDLSPTEQAAALRLATGRGAAPNWETEKANLVAVGLAEPVGDKQPRLFSDLLTGWLRQGVFQQTPSLRPPGLTPTPPILQPSQPPPRPLYASALIFLVGLAVIVLLAQWLNWGALIVFVLLSVYLAFVLVGDGKITGRDFLEMLDKRIRALVGK